MCSSGPRRSGSSLYTLPIRDGASAMAPEPGEHTDEILSELGYGPEEVAKRRQEGWVS